MSKIWNLLKLSFMLIVLPTLLCAQGDSSKQTIPNFIPEIKQIIDRGKLIIATNKSENPLFQMKDENGEYVGQDMEMAKMIAAALGVPYEILRTAKNNEEVVDSISRGEADIGIAKLSYTADRAKKVLFTRPYVVPNKSLIVNRARLERLNKKLKFQDALNNPSIIIGVTNKSAYADYAKNFFPQAQVKSYKEWEDMLPDMLTGKIFAGFRDEIRVKLLLKEYPEASLNLLPIMLKGEDDPLVMIVRKDAPIFLLWVDTLLERGDYKIPEVNELIDRYKKVLEIKRKK